MEKYITKRTAVILLIFVLVLLSLAGCSSRGNGSKATMDSSGGGGGWGAADAAMPAPAPSPAPTAAHAPEAPMAIAKPDDGMEYDYIEAEGGDGAAAGGGFANQVNGVQNGRKITFSASFNIATKTYDADYAKINNMITQAGGYVASERSNDYSDRYGGPTGRYTYISARIPAEGYDSFLDKLNTVGTVTEKNKWSDDLTAQYFDTEARIEMLEIRKERLMKYLVEAEQAADIVEFERELSNVLYELDSYKGNKRWLDNLVDFATIDVSLNELITPETIGKDGEPLGSRASEAFSLSATGVGRFLEGAVVFFAGAAPVLALLAVIAVIIWFFVRMTRPLRERRRERKEKREAQRMQKRQQKHAPTYVPTYAQMQQQPAPPPAPQPAPQPAMEPVQPAPAPQPAPQPATEPVQPAPAPAPQPAEPPLAEEQDAPVSDKADDAGAE